MIEVYKSSFSVKNVQKNYITEVGFTPRLYQFDTDNNLLVREGYIEAKGGLRYTKFYDSSKRINSVRYLNYSNSSFWNSDGSLNQVNQSLNSALFFKNLSAVYYVASYDLIHLKYSFDLLKNNKAISPGEYRNWNVKVGYNSANNQQLRYRFNLQKGSLYGGEKLSAGLYLNYQLLPFASFELSYEVNKIILYELGKETFYLSRFTGEVFLYTRLNWTTYIQYNTQQNNFNINSRIQWEYKPLSYVYFVVTDNLNTDFQRKNWVVAFKMNYRFDF